MGRAQVMQAEAAGITPLVCMNQSDSKISSGVPYRSTYSPLRQSILSETIFASSNLIVDEVMELTHITDLSEKDFDKISDGQKQRVMIRHRISPSRSLISISFISSLLSYPTHIFFVEK